MMCNRERMFRVVCSGYIGRSPFDPHLRGERRTFDIPAKSKQHARQLFDMAVSIKISHVMGAMGSYKLDSIEEIDFVGIE